MGGGKSSTSTQSVSIPPEVLARYNAVNARAENVAQQPFQQYGGEFVAPLTPTQTAGIENTSAASQLAQPYYGAATQGLLGAQQGGANYIGAATGAALAGAMPVSPSGLQVGRYMNPYTENVVGATQAAMNQQQGQQLSQQQSEAIRAGAFGGDRAGLQRQALRGQQSLAQSQAIAPLYQQNYQQALQTAQQQQGVGLGAEQANRQAVQQLGQQLGGLGQQGYAMGAGASQQLAGLGTGAQQAALQGAQAQIGAGTLQQQTQQAQDTAQYQQFLQQRGYDFQVAQFLANIAMGTGALSGSTTTSTQPRGFFSNRGGFKTGDSLRRTGKAYGGGLDPNSMGGAVYEPGAFERGGYATAGSVVDSNDLAAILAQQRQSFGPFAAAGPYGQAAGATPHGPGGIVPQQQMHVPKLVTAGAAPKAAPGAGAELGKVYSLADEATKGLSGKGLTQRIGEKMGVRDAPKGANDVDVKDAGQTRDLTESEFKNLAKPSSPATPDASTASSSGGFGDFISNLNPFKSEGGGIMPRHHYADGGGEDSQGDEAVPYDPSDVMSGKDPMEGVLKAGGQKPQMLKPSGGGGGGGGGLGGDIAKGVGLAKTAFDIGKFFLANGGVVPRHGYQTAGTVDDLPINAEIVERAPGLDPNVVSELRREEQRPAAIPQEVKNLASDPTLIRSESGGNWEAENKARGHGGMYGHFGRAQFGHARLQDAMNAGVVPEGTTPQQFMDNAKLQEKTEAWHFGDISNFIANKGYDRLIGTKINGIPVTEQGMINAAHLGGKGGLQKYLESGGQINPNDGRKSLSDYMAMGAGMTGFDRSGQGLGAGRPPQDVGRPAEGKSAELGFFDRNKGIILPVLQGIGAMASSKSISPWAAALQGLGAGAKAYGDVEKQQADIQESKARSIEGLSRVGQIIGKFDANGQPIYDVKNITYGGQSLKPKTSMEALEQGQQQQRKKAEELIGGPVPVTDLSRTKPQGPAANLAQQEHTAMLSSMSPESDAVANNKLLDTARESVKSSQSAKNQMNNLALPITGLAAGQVIEPNALAPVLGGLLTKFNSVLDTAGIPRIAPGTMTQIALADKMQAVMASDAVKNLGMHARGVLEDVTKAFATKAIDKDAAASLLASGYVDNYKDEHRNEFTLNYGDPTRTGMLNPVAKNANAAYRLQNPEYELENQFLKEKAHVKDFLLLPGLKDPRTKLPTGEHLLSYLMGEGKNKEIAKIYTPEVIERLLKEKYGADITKYFKNKGASGG